MTLSDLTPNTLKALRPTTAAAAADPRPIWQRRLSSRSTFCQSLVACGYMTAEQMQHAAAA